MKNKYGILVIIAIVAIGGVFMWQRFYSQQSSVSSSAEATLLTNIPTPAGWYSWGKEKLPLGSKSATVTNITFGNQPMSASGNNTTSLITAGTVETFGKTDEQWVDSVLAPMIAGNESVTSSQLWDVISGRLVLELETMTPAGGYSLTYCLFDNGTIYSFSLTPSYLIPEYKNKDLANTLDGQTLFAMVQNFAKKLPPGKSQ